MKIAQITQVMTDINNTTHVLDAWFRPAKFAYVVLKDNSLLYIDERDMWYFDSTDEILYVASAIYNTTTKELEMPTTGVIHQDNIDRMHDIIDFENINQIVLNYRGQYLGGQRW